MKVAQKTVVINRQLDSVFEFVLNGAANRLWQSRVLEVEALSEQPYGMGSKFRQVLKGAAGGIEADYEITRCEPNKLIEWRLIAGPAKATGTYRFRRQGSQTQLTFTLEYPADGSTPRIGQEVGIVDELKAFLEKHA